MKIQLLTLLISTSLSFSVSAQSALRQRHFNVQASGLAIEGYDPVSYFLAGKPTKGKKEYALFADGITYYFSSKENKEVFKNNPSKYQPRYGGWCAYAMGASGEKVAVDPETYKIISGNLYLFYNKFFNNTLNSWNKNEEQLHKQADANWGKIFQ